MYFVGYDTYISHRGDDYPLDQSMLPHPDVGGVGATRVAR